MLSYSENAGLGTCECSVTITQLESTKNRLNTQMKTSEKRRWKLGECAYQSDRADATLFKFLSSFCSKNMQAPGFECFQIHFVKEENPSLFNIFSIHLFKLVCKKLQAGGIKYLTSS